MSLSANQYWALRSMAADKAAAELARVLRQRHVQWLLLKGPSIATRLYGKDERRPYVDVDALVAPGDFNEAERLLTEMGYEPAPYSSRQLLEHDSPWRRKGGSTIDLHRTFTHLVAPPESVWAALSRAATTVQVGGEAVLVPDMGALGLLVALHALGDAPMEGKSLTDLERACEQLSMASWIDARAIATELGAERNLSAALRLTPRGHDIARSLELPELTRWETALRTGGRASLGMLVAGIGAARGLHAKATMVRRLFGASEDSAEAVSVRSPRSARDRSRHLARALWKLPVGIAAWWVQRHDRRSSQRNA
jgi:hypothetical protein